MSLGSNANKAGYTAVKNVTDRPTDRPTDTERCNVACPRLKNTPECRKIGITNGPTDGPTESIKIRRDLSFFHLHAMLLHTLLCQTVCPSVSWQSVSPSVRILFELRAVSALLLLPNHLQGVCCVSGFVFLELAKPPHKYAGVYVGR